MHVFGVLESARSGKYRGNLYRFIIEIQQTIRTAFFHQVKVELWPRIHDFPVRIYQVLGYNQCVWFWIKSFYYWYIKYENSRTVYRLRFYPVDTSFSLSLKYFKNYYFLPIRTERIENMSILTWNLQEGQVFSFQSKFIVFDKHIMIYCSALSGMWHEQNDVNLKFLSRCVPFIGEIVGYAESPTEHNFMMS